MESFAMDILTKSYFLAGRTRPRGRAALIGPLP
jgi:hypothetical protein